MSHQSQYIYIYMSHQSQYIYIYTYLAIYLPIHLFIHINFCIYSFMVLPNHSYICTKLLLPTTTTTHHLSPWKVYSTQ